MTSPRVGRSDPVDRLAILLWIRGPRAIIARFPGARGVIGDGHMLAAFPPLAVLAPLLVAGGAFAVGGGRLGFDDVYTESITLMGVAIALGAFSTQLGLVAVAGFGLGELFLAERSWSLDSSPFGADGALSTGLIGNLARVRLPLVITYLLLAVAVVVIPRTGRALVAQLGRWRRIPPSLAWPVASGLFVIILWLALRTWVAAAPTLVRPRFTWLDGAPTAAAIGPLQEQGNVLVASGVAAGMVRQVVIGLSLWWEPFRNRVRAVEADPVAADSGRPRLPRPPSTGRRLAGDVTSATLATLVLAGVLERAWLWALAFGTLFVVRLLRSGVIAAAVVERWKRTTARVPAVVRLVVLFLVVRLMTDALAQGVITSYTAIGLVVIAGAVLVFAVFPGTPAPRGDVSPADEPGRVG